MAIAFNRKLKSLEETINSTKFNTIENVFKTSPDEIRKHLKKLIRFVEDGLFASSETEKFICKNFRDKNEKILKSWNKTHPTKQKASATLRVQIRNLSNKFYRIFGDNFDTFYYNGSIEVIQKFSNICDALRIEQNVDLSSVFIDEVYTLTGDANEKTYDVNDCKDEFILLRRLMKSNIEKNFDVVDRDKLLYIINNLNPPIVGADTKHLNSVKVWLLSHLYSLQREELPRETIPLKEKGKKHLFENEKLVSTYQDEITSDYVEETVLNTEIEQENISEPTEVNILNIKDKTNGEVENLTFLEESEPVENELTAEELNVLNMKVSADDLDLLDDEGVSEGEVLDAGEFDFSFDQELASGTSLYILIDQFWDFISYIDSGVEQPKLSKQEQKEELLRIKQFFALYTPVGLLKYLKEQNFNRVLFEKALLAYENAVEKNDKI